MLWSKFVLRNAGWRTVPAGDTAHRGWVLGPRGAWNRVVYPERVVGVEYVYIVNQVDVFDLREGTERDNRFLAFASLFVVVVLVSGGWLGTSRPGRVGVHIGYWPR